MLTGAETKSDRALNKPGGNLEIWSCGCTVIGGAAQINVRCLSCGNVFKKAGGRNKMAGLKKVKTDNNRMELVSNIQALFPAAEEAASCQHCNDAGEIKVFTQEWDRIKSHMAPCPVCYSQEWLDWSAGKRIVK
ncbi:MAG: hypothetical protein K6T65_12560 [Peptococcaceae bacterium]|nr:hypothetical protein [Peptococcaceae bacterium]